ncbi:MAG: Dimeric dUTPase (EC [uncultured Sulfurovum sp.]|uniref:Dimeric dUTPase (EC) n=1 Tax=uncultured Sulfurovum sp. TaxID=269237 RepID=A0A6S6SFW1_9BACT|nr:MAG: Dimeric dUTPase (EC [uncultured Sulfurovum sp.]
MHRILQMLELQQELNDKTNGKNWEIGITKNGKKIDWRRCIYLEAAELVESYPWKHWKNIDASPDYENIKIEIVDIWHFVMSEALRLYKMENKGSIPDIATAITTMEGFNAFLDAKKGEQLNPYIQIELVEKMIKTLFCNDDIDALVISFLTMASKLNLKLPELYTLYVGKNILNKFRQNHGYKDGSYIKDWYGKEDNLVMQELLMQRSDITPKELYNALEKAYPKM